MSNRGLTLVEVLVAGAVFALMMVAVMAIESTFRQSTRQADRESEVYRAVRLGFEHLRAELEGAYVPPFTTGSELDYYPPVLLGGAPVLGVSGVAECQPKCTLKVDDEGRLVRVQGDEARPLAFLGGSARFEMARDDLLQVTLHAERDKTIEEQTVRFYLRNQN